MPIYTQELIYGRGVLTALVLSLIPGLPQATDPFPADGTPIGRPGIPGTLCIYGEDARAVLTSGDKHPRAVAGVASLGKGRLFAVTHDGYRAAEHFEDGGLMSAALTWLRAGDAPGKVSLLTPHAGFTSTLEGLGFEVIPFRTESLEELQILFVSGEGPIPEAELEAIGAWIEQGGALCATACPWGWMQIHGSKGWRLTEEMTANRLLARGGLLFTDGYAGAHSQGKFVVDRAAAEAISCAALTERLELGDPPADLTPLEDALRFLPLDDPLLLPRLQAALPKLDASNAPSPDHPLTAKDHALERLAVIAMHRRLVAPAAAASTSPPAPALAPGTAAFPGSSGQGLAPYAKTLRLDPTVPGWQSTGLYLDPGRHLQLTFTGEAAGWTVRIGAHADRLWHKARWPRWPEVSKVVPLAPRLHSPFGGLVYFQADAKEASSLEIQVAGAVPAPYWVSGKTTAREWKKLRKAPGPWAELQGKSLILTIPSSAVRELKDPQELMDWWDRVVLEQFTFGAESPPARPERFVSDILISAGYMHAGYPIMMHLDVAEPREDGRPAVLLDLEELQSKGNWGCFHELGHNRQKPTWTFGGTGEVTNNLFSLHSGEHMSGIEPWRNSWLENQKMAGRAYLRDGADFAVWKRKPGIALLCYAQIQKEFGWEPFHQTFAAAGALTPHEIPRTDAEKRTFWIRFMSFHTGRDLRDFHAHWGWPIEPSLRDDPELDRLKPWMPDFKELGR